MNLLSYNTLKEQNYKGFILENAPERILQFGNGSFMRAFVDYFVDILNEQADFNSKIVISKLTDSKSNDKENEQDGLYTLILRGNDNGKSVSETRVISSVSKVISPYEDYNNFLELSKNPHLRFITCNSTEAGIIFNDTCKFSDAPPKTFPAKLTRFMYERFKLGLKGFVILACELIDDNGKELKNCVIEYAKLWNLGKDFIDFLQNDNIFCSTLVDRIVTGYPKGEDLEIFKSLGYKDNMLNTAENFAFWAIEGPKSLEDELPFKKANLPVIITENHKPYKEMKVRILNGAHTSMVLGTYLSGFDIVRDCMKNDVISDFLNKVIYDEIIPTLDLVNDEVFDFSKSVKFRFENPFIDHKLLAISLNSTAKWKARVLPSLKKYIEIKKELPKYLTMSLAFYIEFYRGKEIRQNTLIGVRNNEEYSIHDDIDVLEFFLSHKNSSDEEIVLKVLENNEFFGENLTKYDGLYEKVLENVKIIKKQGALALMNM